MILKLPSGSFRYSRMLLLFLVMALSSNAQTFNFRNYSLDDGLSQSEITCMFEDSRGYLWIGTAGGGLNRFDGKEFKIYEEKDGLCGQIISAVSEDKFHNIWIGNVSGRICVFNGQTFENVSKNDPSYIANGKINFLTGDDDDNMIVGKNNELFLYNRNHFEKLTLKDDTISGYTINCFKKDSRNILWVGTTKGLLVLKNKTLLRIKDTHEIDKANITSVTEDVNGDLCVVRDNTDFYKIKITGPSHYQVKVTQFNPFTLPSETFVDDILFDRFDQLWIATENKGVFKYANNALQRFDQNNGLSVDVINCIYEDRSGTLWLGTSGGGLLKYANQAFTYFDNIIGLKEKDIYGIKQDAKGNMWIGTSLHGVYKFDGKKVTSYSNMDGIENLDIRCFYTDHKGNVWLGSNKGIFIYNDSTFHFYKKSQKCKNIRAIFKDNSGNIWIGTRGSGVFIDNGKELKQFKNKNGPDNNVYAFVQEKNGQIWMATGAGIYIYNDGRIIKHLVDSGNGYISCLVMDKFGGIWAGTDHGVGIYKGNKFKYITVDNGLASGTVYSMNIDKYGNVWVGTNKGLDKITLDKKGEIESIRNYNKNEGFKGIECNSRATCIDDKGCLWFGTIKGAIKYDPIEEFFHEPEVPQVYLVNVKLFYETVDWKKYSDSILHWYNLPYEAVLPYDKNHLTFNFSAFSKAFPENIKYSFILEGFDKEWSPTAEINSITYSNLPPGKYTFLVKAINKSGISSKVSDKFEFTITKPFWITWWFIAFCLLGFIAFIYFYNEYRKRRYVLFQKHLEKIIKQRTREIAKQRDTNEILLKEVHHRVKNNLQIINSLINIQSSYVNEPKSAELFQEIRNRIRSISLVHEKLYRSTDYGNMNVKEYINMLVEGLISTYNINKQVELKLNLEVQYFNLNTIIPLGLLLNEIISNSFKYAFNEVDKGIIEVELHKSAGDNAYDLIIGDNGKGYDNKLFENPDATLGLELMKILSAQLNGAIKKMDRAGTYYLIKFKPLKD